MTIRPSMHRLTLVLAMLLCGTFASAQDIKVGLKGGYNYVSVHRVAQVNILRTLEPLQPRNSFHFGLTTRFGLSDGVGVQFEPSFVEKGVIRGGDKKESLSYFEMPVLLTVNLWKNLHVEFGPAAGFLLNANVKEGTETSIKMVTNNREFSLLIGSSWDLNTRLNVGGRYSRSLTTVSELQFTNESGFITDEFEEYNQYFELFVRLYLL